MSEGWAGALAILGLAVVTVVTRNFFLFPEREVKIPARLQLDEPGLPVGVARTSPWKLGQEQRG